MKVINTTHSATVIGLATLLLSIGAARADFTNWQPDSDFLTRWEATFDGLRDMSPKWGKQGADAFKVSLDVGVPIVFLNVCTPEEWQAGVIKDALLINLNDLPKPESLAMLPEDRSTIIGVQCMSGHRSTLALVLLHQLGYKNAINMSGGMKAWREAGFPVTEPEK